MQKPVDMDHLASVIRKRLVNETQQVLRESTIGELMTPISSCHRVYDDQPIRAVAEILRCSSSHGSETDILKSSRPSVLVFDRTEKYIGCFGTSDLLQLVLPNFLKDSPYASFFTGMFLAQCKIIGNEPIGQLIGKQHTIDIHAPLLQAIDSMVRFGLADLPVLQNGVLVGILKDQNLLREIANCITGQKTQSP
ncbi:MAG: CBS domain-containing protein [Pseudomonadota bacterium]